MALIEDFRHHLKDFGPLSATFTAFVIWYLSRIVYRLFFHPLANVPGPKLAAATSWYEFYYDVVKNGGGQYNWSKIGQLHEQYGPIIRINPREVHIKDSSFFDNQHSMSAKLSKDYRYYSLMNQDLAAVTVVNHEDYRLRRIAVNKSFAPPAIAKIEPLLQERLRALFKRLLESQDTKQPEALGHGLKSYATDVINAYTLPNAPYHIEDKNFEVIYNESIRSILRLGVLNIHFPFAWTLMEATPLAVLRYLLPPEQTQVFERNASLQRNAALVAQTKGNPPVSSEKSWPLVLNEIYKHPSLPFEEKTERYMRNTASSLTAAGGETTGSTLSMITYHLLKNKTKLARLRSELATVTTLDDPTAALTSYRTLEKLPYLNACITEGLRVTTPVSGRLPRFNPSQTTVYGKYSLPPRTIISMSISDLHWDPTVFGHDPHAFIPERWLVSESERRLLEKNMAPFGRGSRNCVGQSLAMAELLLATGNLFAAFGDNMELYETTDRDMLHSADFFVSMPPVDTLGLRVTVR